VYLGIFPGLIGYAGWSYVLARIPASRAGTFMYFTPLGAIFIAWFWLGELPGLPALIGGCFIIAGVVIVNVLGRRPRTAAPVVPEGAASIPSANADNG
jgi:drug/metabolite transporter (DMT)-like permease